MRSLALACALLAQAAGADVVPAGALDFGGADVVFLGEVHDDPRHHRNQTAWVSRIEPTALVFEMMSPDQAAVAMSMPEASTPDLAAALGWDASGWPDFAMYRPILLAAPQAAIFGAAVPRVELMRARQDGAAAVLGPDAATLGIAPDLPPDQAEARRRLQAEAHCNALPPEALGGMVEVQRLRDAALALAALSALADHGPPVVVITGNGHARSDWGAPAMVRAAAPNAVVLSVGQLDAAARDAPFDLQVVTGPLPRAADLCEAFR